MSKEKNIKKIIIERWIKYILDTTEYKDESKMRYIPKNYQK